MRLLSLHIIKTMVLWKCLVALAPWVVGFGLWPPSSSPPLLYKNHCLTTERVYVCVFCVIKCRHLYVYIFMWPIIDHNVKQKFKCIDISRQSNTIYSVHTLDIHTHSATTSKNGYDSLWLLCMHAYAQWIIKDSKCQLGNEINPFHETSLTGERDSVQW